MTAAALTHLSLFSGIGGIDLAAERAGFQTIGQVERDPYCRLVLQKNFPGIHIWRDVNDLTIDTFREHCGTQPPVLLSGGFPCQPYSTSGKRRGKDDDRYLWPEMFRVVQELRPNWVLGENVAGFISMGLDASLADLESIGYSCRAFVLPACAVGAWHRRDRVFIIANTGHSAGGAQSKLQPEISKEPTPGSGGRIHPPITTNPNHPNGACDRDASGVGGAGEQVSRDGGRPWAFEPGMDRVVTGVPRRVDRLRGLGNAVVPQQVYPILRGIAEIIGEDVNGR